MNGSHPSLSDLGDRVGDVAASQLIAAFRTMLLPMRSEGVTLGENWVRACTGEAHPFGNLLIGLEPDDVEGLEGALGPLVDVAAPSVVVYPFPAVSEAVHEHLAARGYELDDAMPAMAVEISRLAPTALPDGYEMVDVGQGEEADDWVEAFSAGYEIPRDLAALFTPQVHGPGSALSFSAVVKSGRMVATTTMFLDGAIAGIYCVSTVPEERGKGLGAHLTAEPLRRAAAKGYRVGVLQSSAMGHSVYRRLGFEDVGEVQMYLRVPC